jgi:hypothetical protein
LNKARADQESGSDGAVINRAASAQGSVISFTLEAQRMLKEGRFVITDLLADAEEHAENLQNYSM